MKRSLCVGHSLLALVLPLALSCSTVAKAEDDYFSMDLMELQQVKLSSVASKSVRASYESPAVTTVITSDDLKRFGYRTLADAMRFIAGFYTHTDLLYNFLGVRGFSDPITYNPRVLLMIDGHKVNEPFWDYAGIGEDFHLDLEQVDRIEVIKGPVSAVWGTNALLGVINVIPKRGRDLQGVHTLVEGGGQERRKFTVTTGKLYENGAEVLAGVSKMRSAGARSVYYPGYDRPEYNNGMTWGTDEEEFEREFARVSYGPFSAFLVMGRWEKGEPAATYLSAFGSDYNATVERHKYADVKYNDLLPGRKATWLEVRTYYDETHYYFDSAYWGEIGRNFTSTYHDGSRTRLFGIESNVTTLISSEASLVVGTEYKEAQKVNRYGYTDWPEYSLDRDTNAEFAIASLYGEMGYRPIPDLSVVGGLRADRYSARGTEIAPRFGFAYELNRSMVLRGTTSQAYRSPDMGDLYVVDTNDKTNQTVIRSLRAEKLLTYEFSFEYKINPRSSTVLSYYHNTLKDPISASSVYNSKGNINGPNQVVEGIEFQNILRLTNNTILNVAASWIVDAEEKGGKSLVNAPQQVYTVGLSYPLFGGALLVTPELQYLGSVRTVKGNVISETVTTNLTLLAPKVYLNNLSLGLTSYNIFHERVRYPGGPGHDYDDIIPGEKPVLSAFLRYKF